MSQRDNTVIKKNQETSGKCYNRLLKIDELNSSYPYELCKRYSTHPKAGSYGGKEGTASDMKKICILILFFIFFMTYFQDLSVVAQGRSKDIQDWLTFRGNEDANKGKVVTWKCVYTGHFVKGTFLIYKKFEASELYLKDDSRKKVFVDGGPYLRGFFEKESYSVWEGMKRPDKNDLLEITGEFYQVFEGGIYLKPIKIKKIGFVE